MKRFYRLTPHFRLSSNPLFALEVRRVRRGDTAKALIDYSVLLVVAVCVGVLLLWLLALLENRDSWENIMSGDFPLALFALSLLVGLALDFSSMSNSFGSINGEITAGRWDLLRLTVLPSKQIVAAKYGAAQVRVWRLMMLIIALRIAIALVVALTLALVLLGNTQPNTLTTSEIINIITGQLVFVGCGVIFVVEPFWRMRTVTALGIAVSARARQPISSVLVAVGTVAAFWLVQGIVVAALALAAGFLLIPLGLAESAMNSLVFCSPLLFVFVLAVTVYGFYTVVQTWAVRRAERFVLRLD